MMATTTLAARLRSRFGWIGPAGPGHRRALILLSGLPGTGKSHLARIIAERHPAVVVRTDEVRKAIFRHPTYSGDESGVVYLTGYALLGSLLADGYTVVFDATNLTRSGRMRARSVAGAAGALVLTLFIVAPAAIVADRLRRRASGQLEPFSSDADWLVYQNMAAGAEPPGDEGNVVVVDTAHDLEPALQAIDAFLTASNAPPGPGGTDEVPAGSTPPTHEGARQHG